MVKKFTGKLKGKVKRFFKNPLKVARLRRAKKPHSGSLSMGVYKVNIGGKQRFVKINSAQQVQRENLKRLFRLHEKAIKNGTISAKLYSLASTDIFHYSDHRVGVMEDIGGVTLKDLKYAGYNVRQGEKMHPVSKWSENFLKKHPEITPNVIINLELELVHNFQTIFDARKQKDIAFDFKGSNVRIVGFDEKSKKFIIKIFDQVPQRGVSDYGVDIHDSADDMAKRYGFKKRKKGYIE
jgi:hypothetical protein